ncbi:lactonase family protein [Pantoea sp. Tr-811]|uniref:lactonase family protein n=1 Tax=Pantoea sp. Tr-811 TaxID=2608361 RepID=UPI001964F77F|nr:lactonase family protein [Pantoea sp. Tr-811]
MQGDDQGAGARLPKAQAAMYRRTFIQQLGAAAGVSLLGSLLPPGIALAAASPLSNASANGRTTPMYAYVGSRTTRERNARGDGITVYRVDQQAGTLAQVQVVGDLVNPSFLALNRAGDRLYTVHGDQSDVSAFAVDKASGRLSFLNRQSCEGKNPVHLALDPSERFLVVSNHIGGSLAVLNVEPDGRLGSLNQLLKLEGPTGPHRVEQPFAKPHFNPFDASGNFVLVPDKGLDRIFSLRFDNGKLYPAEQPFVTTREGAGPRHLALHPSAPFAYVVNELDSTVTTYRFNPLTGALQPLQILSSLPATFTGNSRASEIEVDRAGRFVYASNRGYDSLAVYAIDAHSGLLSLVDVQPSAGKTPRFFTLTPNQRFVFALNEDSDSIVALAVDAQHGRLSPTGFSVSTGSPVCMVFSA